MHRFYLIHHNINGEFFMDKKSYAKLVKELSPKEPKLKNAIIAFVIGGLIGIFTEAVASFIMYSFALSKTDSYIWTMILTIFIVVLLTALGKFDNVVSKIKCGLIIPTTGFAHSVASCALDYKKDGLITGLGSNFFKLAGSVILFGIISSFILVVIEVIIHG